MRLAEGTKRCLGERMARYSLREGTHLATGGATVGQQHSRYSGQDYAVRMQKREAFFSDVGWCWR